MARGPDPADLTIRAYLGGLLLIAGLAAILIALVGTLP
jgi:hypothetical protein